MKRYQQIASVLLAADNCGKSGNKEWQDRHESKIFQVVRDHMPSGSGFDSGPTLDDASTPQRLVFNTSFHHMDEWGGYAGWTEHQVIITPCLWSGFNIRVTGRDRNDIKEYIAEAFQTALDADIDQQAERAVA